MIVKPSMAKFFYNMDSANETTRQLATSGGLGIVSIIVTAGAQPAVVRVSDTANGAGGVTSSKSILLACNAGESTTYQPSQPTKFDNGIYIEIEQGTPSAEAFISYT